MAQPFPALRRDTGDEPLRCAILISGSGSGMAAMIRHQASNTDCGHHTVLVLSDRPDAGGLERARALGVEATSIPLPSDETNSKNRRESHERLVHEKLVSEGIELVILSGYMRLLSPWFIQKWAPNILNIHPSLLPAFPGAHAHRDVLRAKVRVSGCTVHCVDEGMDTGEILAQRRVPVFPDDTEASLSARVKVEEHTLYPQVIDSLINPDVEGD